MLSFANLHLCADPKFEGRRCCPPQRAFNKKAAALAKTAMDIAMGIKTKRTKTTKKSEAAPGNGGRGRGGHGKGKGNPGRGRGKGRGKDDGVEEGALPPEAPGKKKRMLPAESSDSASSDTESSLDEHWQEVMKSLRKKSSKTHVPKSGQAPALAKAPPAAPVPKPPPALTPGTTPAPRAAKAPAPGVATVPKPPPAPTPGTGATTTPAPGSVAVPKLPPPPGIAAPGAATEPPPLLPPPPNFAGRGAGVPRHHSRSSEPRVIQTLGLAQISETWEDGAHIGYRITCRRHNNAGDADHTQCQKDITMGKTHDRLENTECVRRLKRWFLGGANYANESRWPVGERRSYHVIRYGGPRLQELATDRLDSPLYGVDDSELDALCEYVSAAPAAT